ncbi:MAG: shikimate kinase [Terriglobia bacterium]
MPALKAAGTAAPTLHETMTRHHRKLIYLLGFMGCGKSTVGQLLAREAGWPFIDLDSTIEAGQGNSIREIFEKDGEPFFRRVEHAALTEALKTEPAVIALGGGTWVQEPNMDLIHRTGGATVWLDCSLNELRRRCEGITNRPLFRSPESFAGLFSQRMPFYQLADFRVSTEGSAPEEVVERILRLNIF